MLRIFRDFFAVFILMSIFIACSDDSTSSNNDSDTPPNIQIKTIPIPEALAQATDQNAQMTVVYINSVNIFSVYQAFFTPLSGTSNNGEYQWTSGGLSLRMVFDETSSDYSWAIYITGDMGEATVNNWLYMDAHSSKDGKNGTWNIYDPTTNLSETEWTWTTGSDNVYNVVMDYSYGSISASSNPDKSGTIQVYSDAILSWTSSWTAAGTGTWMEYDSEGNLSDSGSW